MRMTRGRRIVVVLLSAFAAWHVFASFLWIGPYSGIRQAVPGDLLQQYMIPMFGQSWSVFAPDPINGDYRLQIRATLGEDEDARETEFVDATAAELAMLSHNLTPPRAAIHANEVTSNLFNAFNRLSNEQKEIAALGYYNGDDWNDRLSAALAVTGDPALATAYFEAEQTVTAYATQVAHAVWGEEVAFVQFVVSRQNVVPYADRDDPDVQRPPVQSVPTGWRGLLEHEGQSRENFTNVFLRGMELSGQAELIETRA
ncbi:hypothetical protein GCM10011490_16810 [Pseudoclavibacter endophyticus]|nr:hypothetical protein GCM10011490_16810 [Pseudoclavibacter endophyticus]